MKRKCTLFILLAVCLSLTAQTADRELLDAYQRQDMSVWKAYVEKSCVQGITPEVLLYEYGFCGYIVAEAKKEGKESLLPEAKRAVRQFKSHVEQLHSLPDKEGIGLPPGHYEMYISAVYVYELRLKESIHPIKAMSLAKEAVQKAPKDPLVLSYYGTCLFYAPKPFGSKSEALTYFEKADRLFQTPEWQFCWVREATKMYITQCHEKLKR
ncbi:MAG: hypothetical protein II928_03525 [Paludibacteraceae bacterium]|nr:hypothetical protein [Paludibacteraceae bacterium]